MLVLFYVYQMAESTPEASIIMHLICQALQDLAVLRVNLLLCLLAAHRIGAICPHLSLSFPNPSPGEDIQESSLRSSSSPLTWQFYHRHALPSPSTTSPQHSEPRHLVSSTFATSHTSIFNFPYVSITHTHFLSLVSLSTEESCKYCGAHEASHVTCHSPHRMRIDSELISQVTPPRTHLSLQQHTTALSHHPQTCPA